MKKNPINSSIIGPDSEPLSGFQDAIMKAVSLQRPLVLAYLRRMRSKHPAKTAAELAKIVERDYLLTITGSGAAVGTTAVIPGVGTVAALGFSAAATVAFLDASALYAQSLSELHGITTEDPHKARLLVMSILLGGAGGSMLSALTQQVAGGGSGPVKGWAAMLGSSKASGLVLTLQKTMQRFFLKKMMLTQGASMLGRMLPFGIGAVVGGFGNRILGKRVTKAAARAFGTLPTTIPAVLVSKSEGT